VAVVIHIEHPVPVGLAGEITRMWFLETAPARRYEKILPMPFAHLIVNLSDPYRIHDHDAAASIVPNAFVSGLQSAYLVIESPPRIRHLGVEFTPTGLACFAPTPAQATAGAVRDAGTVIEGICALTARVRTMDDASDALAALDRFLLGLERHRADPVTVAAVARIERDPERPIGEVAAELGVSHDALIDRFRRATATTPKRHARIVRFHRFIDAVHAGGGTPDWAALAVTAGYYDQPHVIREFRRFSGWTPAEYYRLVAQHGPEAAHFVPLDQLPAQAIS
jgi:AraC-like DNA-binding protein